LSGAADARVRQEEFDQREVISSSDLLVRLRETLEDVDRVLREFDTKKLLENYFIQGSEVTALEAIFHVTEHFSMHAGQIILLTKLLTGSDLGFYEFENGVPIQRRRSESSS